MGLNPRGCGVVFGLHFPQSLFRAMPRLLSIAALVFLFTGCLATQQVPTQPRTAEIAEPGQFGFNHSTSVVSGASATATGRRTDTGEAVSHDGWEFSLFPAADITLAPRLGLFKPCELGAMISLPFTRNAFELRCGVLQESWGDPLSVAVGGAFGVQGLWDRQEGVWSRVSVDVSRRWPDLVVLGNIGLTYGNEVQLFFYDEIDPPQYGGIPPVGSTNDGFETYELLARRDELRLGIAAGIGAETEDVTVFAWISPWFVLATGKANELVCPDCGGYTPLNMRHHFTLSAGVGVNLLADHDGYNRAEDQYTAGLALLITGYVLGVGGSGFYYVGQPEDLAPWGWSFIPLVGPVLWAHLMNDGDRTYGGEYAVGYGTSALQVFGLALLLYGLLDDSPTPDYDFHISPTSQGAALSGTF